jgi:tRNA-splicing ligase RtcB (3'-phosphate/5'-hydroxy nucleic acid ligase)
MVPIKYFLAPSLMPDKPTQLQIENTAKNKNIFKHVAIMPDVHSKIGRKCPTGTVVATKNVVLPQVMDTAPNCGMRFLKTPWNEKNFSAEQINKLFLELIHKVPTRTYFGNWIDFKTAFGICRFGSKALLNFLGKDEKETENMYQRGNFFSESPSQKEILDAVPKIFLRIAQFRLGILGEAGNHFLDLMKVDPINKEKAAVLGLEKGQYIFLMHTGSGVFGQYASYFFTPKKEEHLSMKIITNLGRRTFNSDLLSKKEILKLQQEVKEYREKKEFFEIDPLSKRGQAFLIANRASANYGFANRIMLTKNIEEAIQKTFREKINLELVYDIPHVLLAKEKHFGEDVWVHRNGASRGFGPSRMKDHPLFSKTGELGVLAGSMSTPSYLVGGTDENRDTFYSINHGAGKSKQSEENAPQSKKELFKNMKDKEIKLYNAKSKGVVQQASHYYKNINEILETAQNSQIADPIAKLTPVAVLMA